MATASTTRISPLRTLVQYTRAPGEPVYAVVDGARNLELAHTARDSYRQRICTLFEEPLACRLKGVAPYVVPIDPMSDYLELWERHLHSNVGVLLFTEASLQDLRAHLQTIFVVTDEEDADYFFRFYDPRVLRAFLPTCTPQEAKEFFGPIRCILVEAEQRGVVLSCRPDAAGVKTIERPLPQTGPATSTPRTRQ